MYASMQRLLISQKVKRQIRRAAPRVIRKSNKGKENYYDDYEDRQDSYPYASSHPVSPSKN